VSQDTPRPRRHRQRRQLPPASARGPHHVGQDLTVDVPPASAALVIAK